MDVDSAGKGKTVPTCNICGGRGHFAKVCPSCATSGYEATVEEEVEKIESGKEDA
jgi:DnaJ-class molecular chaperone